LTPEEKKKIVETLLKEKAKLEVKIADLKELTKPISPSDAIGRVSRMDAINNKSVNEASLRQAEGKLSNLNHVLTKLGTKDFGLCLSCKEEIPLGRILFRPESLHCVKCAR